MIKHVSRSGWFLAAFAALALQLPLARADIVSTDQMTSETPAGTDARHDAERARVKAFIERASVAEKLRTMGVDSIAAEDRVAAMSQEEIHALAQRIDALPAGGALSNTDIVIILLLVILVAVLI